MSKRPKLWMLIGVPCAGKSTWVDYQLENCDDPPFIASTDKLIDAYARLEGKTYNEVFKEYIKAAEKGMYMDLALATQNDMCVIWDQTNLTRKSRAKKLIMIPDHYEKIAVVFPTPDEAELKRRLASRPGKTIPPHILDSMIEMLEWPEKDEGFDTIMQFEDYMLYV